MKYVRARFELPPEGRHPMHQFAVESAFVSDYELRHGWPTPDGGAALLLRFTGDADEYRAAISDVEFVDAFHVSSGTGEAVHVYARDTQAYAPGYTITEFLEPGLVVVLPVVFHDDGSITAAFVGPPAVVQRSLDGLADDVSVTVEALKTYGNHHTEPGDGLTDQQANAVSAAVELGYYGATRAASVADVGDELGCSASTAAEHLRRAEATVMAQVTDR